MVIKKRFMSLLLAVVMAFGIVSPSFAASKDISMQLPAVVEVSDDTWMIDVSYFNEMSESELRAYIFALGVTQEEYEALLAEESVEISPRVSFPKNPKEGDTFVVTSPKIPLAAFSVIGLFDGTATIKQVVEVLKKHITASSIPMIQWVTLAATLIATGAQLAGYDSFQFEIHYYYGMTNNQELGWYYGPIYVKGYK